MKILKTKINTKITLTLAMNCSALGCSDFGHCSTCSLNSDGHPVVWLIRRVSPQSWITNSRLSHGWPNSRRGKSAKIPLKVRDLWILTIFLGTFRRGSGVNADAPEPGIFVQGAPIQTEFRNGTNLKIIDNNSYWKWSF